MRRSFIQNASWMLGGKIFQVLLSLVLMMFTARYLGPSNYGLIGYVASYVAFFTSLCTLGLNGVIINEFIKNKEEQGVYVGTAIFMRVMASTASIGLLQILIFFLYPQNNTIQLISFLSSISLFFHSFDIINYWFQSQLRSKIPVIVTLVSYVLVSFYKIAILVLELSVEWFAAANTIDIILVSILLMFTYKRYGGARLQVSFKIAKYLLLKSYSFIFSGLMVAVFAQTDKIMLGSLLNTTEVGYYVAAITICGMWSFLPATIIDVARPAIMEQKQYSQELYKRRLKQLFAVLIWLSFAYGIFINIFAELIVNILYGEKYLPAISAFRIAVWYCAFSYLGTAKNIWLICEGLQRYEIIFTMIGASINIGLNFLLIPYFGIEGAAIATLLTQITTNFVLPALPKATRLSSKLMAEAFILRDVVNIQTICTYAGNIKSKRWK